MRIGWVLVVAGLAAGPVMAQPAPGAVAVAPGLPAPVSQRASERVERRIEELHRRLAITPAQQPQWDAFAAVMRENALAVEATHVANTPRQASGSALDAMRTYAARARMHAANLDRMLPVFEALYATMSAEQRMVADRSFRDTQRARVGGALP